MISLQHSCWVYVCVYTGLCAAVNVNVKYYSPTAPLSTLLKVPNTFEKFKSYKKLSNKPRLVCVHFLVLPILTLSYGGNETDWLLSLLLLTTVLILSFFVDFFRRWQSLKRNSSLKLFGSDLDRCPAPVKSIHKECSSQFQSTLNYLAAFTKLNCESAGGEGNSSHLFPQIPTMARWSAGTRARLAMFSGHKLPVSLSRVYLGLEQDSCP